MVDNSLPIKPQTNYNCNACDFNSSNKKDYNRHMLTAKHLRIINNTNFTPGEYQCVCGKKYVDNSGLWRHKKKCNTDINFDNEKSDESTAIITVLDYNINDSWVCCLSFKSVSMEICARAIGL